MASLAVRSIREFRKILLSSDAGKKEPSISEWSVGMHIHHCALAMELILGQLRGAVPPIQNKKFSVRKFVVVWLGILPRGKAKAPAATVPDESVDPEAVLAMLDRAERELGTGGASLPGGSWMKHPYFGGLTKWESLRFMAVHNFHHLKIIGEIVDFHSVR